MWFDLPQTYTLLSAGELSEQIADVVVTETRHLDADTRRRVDAQLIRAGITGMGLKAAAMCARRHAYQADPRAYVERGRTERRNRRLRLRPAPDTMAILTGYLPVEQGVACYAALSRHTDATVATGDTRTRDQIMADTLVERLTGQARATDINVELQIMMPLEALLDPDSGRAAAMAGHGPLPADVTKEILASSQGRKWWRRLFTSPSDQLVAGDPHRRRFDGWLNKLIALRDHTCRDPYCDAPIRHHDHITGWANHGATTLTNGRGTCARGNYVRELPGWHLTLVHTGLDRQPHTTVTTTPTGHHYLSRAPMPP